MNADVRLKMIMAPGALAPHPSLGEAASVFDRFVGTWDCHCVFYGVDGAKTEFTGEWIFGWVLDGRIMQDVLSGHPKDESPSPENRRCGTSLRFYDAKAGQWNVVWFGTHNGFVVMVRGGAVEDRIVLEGVDTDGSRIRWSFNDIQAASFLWRGETSSDGGQTWRVEQEMFLKRRSGSTKVAS